MKGSVSVGRGSVHQIGCLCAFNLLRRHGRWLWNVFGQRKDRQTYNDDVILAHARQALGVEMGGHLMDDWKF